MRKYLKLPNGNIIHYLQFGKGEPLILVPSLWVTSKSYGALGKELGEHYKVFVPDLYKGRSSFSKKVTKIEDYTMELASFIKKLEINNYFLVGASLSGIILRNYVLMYSLKPKKMFLVSTSVLPLGLKHQKKALMVGYLKLLYHNIFSVKGISKNILWITDGLEYALRHFDQLMNEGRMAVSTKVKSVKKLPIPTKLVFAKRDEYIPFDVVNRLRKVKNMEIEIVDDYHGWYFGGEKILTEKIVTFFDK